MSKLLEPDKFDRDQFIRVWNEEIKELESMALDIIDGAYESVLDGTVYGIESEHLFMFVKHEETVHIFQPYTGKVVIWYKTNHVGRAHYTNCENLEELREFFRDLYVAIKIAFKEDPNE